ncbi:MAG: hypothetical protein IJP02_06825 [Oscillospiraceae bacterium]|nr:hypothetical protein [Oscillospiraceae bacterium]
MGIYRKSTGTKVTVRYHDIFKENGAAVTAYQVVMGGETFVVVTAVTAG